MALLEIPIRQESAYFRQVTELDGVAYSLSFRWNERAAQWVLDFGDGEGAIVKAGVRCVLGVPLLFQYQGQPGIPPGYLLFVDTTGAGVDAGFADLGRRVVLFYASRADFEALVLEGAAL